MKVPKPKKPEVGKAFVSKFYVVGVSVRAMPGAFAICGTGGLATSSSDSDGLLPTITTDHKKALAWFEMVKEKFKTLEQMGDVLLVTFTDGVVEKMESFNEERAVDG